ncbi:hypothetical protein, partial [Stenotrophomonas maltophilia]|uniref:hypothetical protein n=1 Tax=Stenotrophomonas maltophilia TaxID=40324 RepID=UPI001C655A7A
GRPAHGEEKKEQTATPTAKAADGLLLLLLFFFLLRGLDAAQICQRPDGSGRAGYPRHGWRG